MSYLIDGLAVFGIILIGYGSWLIYPPAGFISVGVIFLGLAYLGSSKGKK